MDRPQPITQDQLDNFSIDKAGRLYWHGREVITTLSLPWFVNAAIVVGAAAGVVAAVWPIIRYFLDKAA